MIYIYIVLFIFIIFMYIKILKQIEKILSIISPGLYFKFITIGVFFHEVSHYIVAKIFKHKIKDTNFIISKEKKDGYVIHYYNHKSIYQKIGSFYISIAPAITMPIFIYVFSLIVPSISSHSYFLINKTLTLISNSDTTNIPFILTNGFLTLIMSFILNKDIFSIRFILYVIVFNSFIICSLPSVKDIRNLKFSFLYAIIPNITIIYGVIKLIIYLNITVISIVIFLLSVSLCTMLVSVTFLGIIVLIYKLKNLVGNKLIFYFK